MKTSLLRLYPLFVLLLCVLSPLPAAINPYAKTHEPFILEKVRLHEIARIVEIDPGEKPQWRRVTIMAKVVEVFAGPLRVGDSILIDYSLDLEALRRNPIPPENLPVYEPLLDENSEFWASLRKSDARLVNNWYGMLQMIFHAGNYPKNKVTGPVYVPYQFHPPK